MWQKMYRYHPVVGWLKIPEKQFRLPFADGVFRYRTNAAGFRGNGEFLIEKAPGTKRILVFGDSFTEGGCVDDGARYTDRLQDSLGTEVYNFGISGTGTDQQYLIYQEIGSRYDHDLVVVGVWAENIRRNVSASRVHRDQDGTHYLTPKPYFTLAGDDGLELHNQPVPRAEPIYDADEDRLEGVDPGTLGRQGLKGAVADALTRLGPGPKRAAQRLSRWQPYPEYDDPDGDPWRLTRRILETWSAESAVPVIVLLIPVYQYVERSAPSDAVRDRFSELHHPPDTYFHDPLPDLWTYPKSERRAFRFPHDHHFTPAGHQALADSVEPLLRELLAT